MKTSSHLLGLFKYWSKDSCEAPYEEGPSHFIEAAIATFDHKPEEMEVFWALNDFKRRFAVMYDRIEVLGRSILRPKQFAAVLAAPGWDRDQIRRIDAGTASTQELERLMQAYGLETAWAHEPQSSLWTPAKNYGPKFDELEESLKEEAKAAAARQRAEQAKRRAFQGRDRDM